MPYVRYNTASGFIIAVTAADPESDMEPGESKFEETTLPDLAVPGNYRASNGSYQVAPLTTATVLALRAAVRAALEHFPVFNARMVDEGIEQAHSLVALWHNFQHRLLQGFYLAMNNHRTGANVDFTVAQRTAAAAKIGVDGLGAADATTPLAFYTALAGGGTALTAPSAPIILVNVNSGAGVNLSAHAANTTAMALDATQLPATSLLDLSWADTLT